MSTWRNPECDCWTDAEGFWQLGPRCRDKELGVWKMLFDRVPAYIEKFRSGSSVQAPRNDVRFVWINGKMQLIQDVYLPKDIEDK